MKKVELTVLILLLSSMASSQFTGENVTRGDIDEIVLELEGVSGQFYTEKGQINIGDSVSQLNYPYIVNDRPQGIVGTDSFVRAGVTSDSVYLSQNSSSFYVVNTEGSRKAVEDRERLVRNRNFIDRLIPAFGFEISREPRVNVVLKKNSSMKGFVGRQDGLLDLFVRNSGSFIRIGLT